MKRKFLLCRTCGNVAEIISDEGVIPDCCGSQMEELIVNTADAALEKHVPVIEVDGKSVTVKVGEIPHPMIEEHYIAWIYLETNKGIHRVDLKPEDEPIAKFALGEDEEVQAAYAYCNLHGLWVKNS